MPYSHATPRADQPGRDLGRLKLLASGTRGLPEGLVARVDGHLARVAEHLREGLLAASVVVGLDVMDELMAAEVTEVAGSPGQARPGTPRDAPRVRRGHGDPGRSTPGHPPAAGAHGRRERRGAAHRLWRLHQP